MVPKLIALDLDETLLNDNGSLSEKNRDALRKAAEQNIEIVLATGRAFSTIPAELREFPKIHYAVTGNGVAVYQVKTGEILHREGLKSTAVEQVLRVTSDQEIMYEAFLNGRAYAQRDYIQNPTPYMADEKAKAYIQESRHPVADIRAFLIENRERLDSMDIVVRNQDTHSRIMELLKSVDGIYVTTSTPRMVEISDQNCGKHRGLEFLSNCLQIRQDETAAFGNADNDADMLRWAGIGVAVENASPNCRAAADYVTESYSEDGVAKALSVLFGIG